MCSSIKTLFFSLLLFSFGQAANACQTSLIDFINQQVETNPTLTYLHKHIKQGESNLGQFRQEKEFCEQHQRWAEEFNAQFSQSNPDDYYYPITCQLHLNLGMQMVKALNALNDHLTKLGAPIKFDDIDEEELFIEQRNGPNIRVVKDVFQYKQFNYMSEKDNYTKHSVHYEGLKNQYFSCPSHELSYIAIHNTPAGNEKIVNKLILSAFKPEERKIFSDPLGAKDILRTYSESAKYMDIKLNYLGNRILSFSLNQSDYTGGAHGNHGAEFFVFDLDKQKRISLKQVFASKKQNEITNISQDYFNQEIQRRGLVKANLFLPVDDQKFLKQQMYHDLKTGFYLPKEYYLSDKGLTFVYGVYEIASYADGMIEFTIPWSSIEAHITPYMKSLLESM